MVTGRGQQRGVSKACLLELGLSRNVAGTGVGVRVRAAPCSGGRAAAGHNGE